MCLRFRFYRLFFYIPSHLILYLFLFNRLLIFTLFKTSFLCYWPLLNPIPLFISISLSTVTAAPADVCSITFLRRLSSFPSFSSHPILFVRINSTYTAKVHTTDDKRATKNNSQRKPKSSSAALVTSLDGTGISISSPDLVRL